MPGIVQSATTHILEIAVTGTGTLAVDHQASGVEQSGATVTPVSQQATVTGAGTTTASSAPGASTQRTVQSLSAMNRGTQPVTVQYQKDVSGTEFDLTPAIPLDPQWSVQYTADRGFRVFDAIGRELGCCMAGYNLLKAPTLLTSGTSYTPSIGCAAILIELWGGGGAGGGGDFGAATTAGAGGGGAAGGYVRKFIIGVPTPIAYAIGAAGAAGAVGNVAGGNGGNTTMTVNGTVYTATAGPGGAGSGVAAATVADSAGGAGVSGTNGDENITSEGGQAGARYSGTQGRGGEGGSSMIGNGGSGRCSQGTGNASTGLASGGGGGMALSADVAGGAGTGGAIRVWEFSAG